MSNKDVTLVITTCNRNDLLERTLTSFFKFNTYPIEKTIIVDDSGIGNTLDWNSIKECIIGPYEIIVNETNIGQIGSIDKAYAKVETNYIFHCEEDWEFNCSGFIEKSFEILNNNKKVFTVWLRAHNDTKRHRIETEHRFDLAGNDYYYLMDQNHKGMWCGFTFNPGLRRTKDCMIFHPYDNLKIRNNKEKKGLDIMHESDLSIYYQELGYRGAITSREEGYVKHIGGKRHIPLPWQK
jgi:GT2 family glycosyltransferase